MQGRWTLKGYLKAWNVQGPCVTAPGACLHIHPVTPMPKEASSGLRSHWPLGRTKAHRSQVSDFQNQNMAVVEGWNNNYIQVIKQSLCFINMFIAFQHQTISFAHTMSQCLLSHLCFSHRLTGVVLDDSNLPLDI